MLAALYQLQAVLTTNYLNEQKIGLQRRREKIRCERLRLYERNRSKQTGDIRGSAAKGGFLADCCCGVPLFRIGAGLHCHRMRRKRELSQGFENAIARAIRDCVRASQGLACMACCIAQVFFLNGDGKATADATAVAPGSLRRRERPRLGSLVFKKS